MKPENKATYHTDSCPIPFRIKFTFKKPLKYTTLKLTYCRWLECLFIICLISSGCVVLRLDVAGWFSSNSKHLQRSGIWNTWFQLLQTWDAWARSRSGKYWNTWRIMSWSRFAQSGLCTTVVFFSTALCLLDSFSVVSSDELLLASLVFLPRFIL